jgi:ribonuclease E
MKRMLLNAAHAEETRVAIVEGQRLIDIDIETAGRESRKSNIYKGVITRIEPSLEACFVNYGEERHGFLSFKEISKIYFKPGTDVARARIQDALSEGTEVIVQVEKEERGNKGAALTTFISLAGRYLVLMPNNPRGGGVSRRVEGEDRQELRETMDKLKYPNGVSLIARTAGIGRSAEELQWDLNFLLQLWTAIESASGAPAPFLIYQESSLVIRAIRDYFTADIGEILIDTDDIYEQARQFMGYVMPDALHKVKRYKEDVPLYSRFQIEHQVETAHSRVVPLPSGGAIVIDHTEALVAIDVNSARSTKGSDIEETALRTNLEAADEAARQMRLRDLAGLIVIDFIDMENSKNQREVEQRLKDALHVDRARVQPGKISRFGLMELSRQRLRPALSEGSHMTCPRCNGTGVIRDVESSSLHSLRVIQEEAMKENTAAVYMQVPVDVATYLLNEKRAEIAKLEAKLKVEVVLIPNKYLETPHYKVERLRHDDERLNDIKTSFSLVAAPNDDDSYMQRKLEPQKPRQEAVVKNFTPDQPAPAAAPKPAPAPVAAPAPVQVKTVISKPMEQGEGFFGKIMGWFRNKPANEAQASPAAANIATPASAGTGSREGGRDGARRNERGDRGPRNDRGDRGPRGDRPPRTDRPARPEGEARGEGQERGDRPRRGDRGPRADRPEGGDRTERQAPQERTERLDSATPGDRPERGPRPDRPRRGEGRGEARSDNRGEAGAEARPEGRDDNRTGGRNEGGRGEGRQGGRGRGPRNTEGGADRLAAATSTLAPLATEGEGIPSTTLLGSVGYATGIDAPGAPVSNELTGDASGQNLDGNASAEGEVGDDTRRGSRRRRGRGRGDRGPRGEGNGSEANGNEASGNEASFHEGDASQDGASQAEAAGGDTAQGASEQASRPPRQPARAVEQASLDLGQPAQSAPAQAAVATGVVAASVAAASAVAAHVAPVEPANTASAPVMPLAAAPAVPVQTAPTPVPAPAPAPAPKAAPAPVAVPDIVSAAVVKQAVDGAGLQWIETKAGSVSSAPEVLAPQPRPVRSRKPKAIVVDEPLQQVETGPK